MKKKRIPPLKTHQMIPERDILSTWAWIDRFRSVPFTAQHLEERHKVPKKHSANISKQAEQIRYCIQQAKEYYEASKAVSLCTRPLLLYYSCMSLALAEILVKQDGMSSLDKARQKHRHHGLLFSENLAAGMSPSDSLMSLRARPMIVESIPTGTFELWRQTAVYASIVSGRNVNYSNSRTESSEILLMGGFLPPFPATGITLLDCLSHYPWMNQHLAHSRIPHRTVRGSLSTTYNEQEKKNVFTIAVHPQLNERIWKVFEHFEIDAHAHSHINIKEVPEGGFILEITFKDDLYSMSAPEGIQERQSEVHFLPPFPLNEYGIIYVSLYILGNLARYFPDKWAHHVEQSSEFAVLVEAFMNIAQYRMPLLFLGELTNKQYLISS